jgi:hypothetical protein
MRAAVLMILGLASVACSDHDGWLPSDSQEIDRIRSPDGKVDAVIYLTPTDPLSSDIQSVRLEPVGEKGEWHGIVARAAHTHGRLGLRWASDTLLEIVYRRGHIYDFNNQWWTYKLSPTKDQVHFVELRLSKEP